ncbi:TraB/GumN family protein [Vagococcus carniphilus]|uniref:TraB/GumN family protein n=1 Tax=Vagococcus carniphilus TaxID=218144 RepID=UPI00289107CF|nr:TraB/GumN family protein [Vagococcus carniphilus]MDT2840925.1 TraB/GumN family protein [Vagococcus carniphilus]
MSNLRETNNITLLGTAHISKESVKEVEELILKKQPKYICIELDKQRYDNLVNDEQWKNTDIVSVIKNKQFPGLVMQVIIASVQKKFSLTTNSEPAGEFKKAIELAKQTNAEIILIDRNIKITLNRIWRKLTLFNKVDIITSFIFGSDDTELTENSIQDIMKDDVMELAFSSFKEKLPIIHKVLVEERDEYMANNILELTTKEEVVVIIGKAHLNGIFNKVKSNSNTHNNAELDIIPNKTLGTKLANWSFSILIIVLLIASFVFGDYNVGMDQLKQWILWNSSLAAIFTLLARGSFISAIVAFLTAPIGAISPALSVGIFVAFSEAIVKKPTVNDMANIFEDTSSIKTILNNKFLKIIVLFFVSSLGGAIGNIIGGSQLIKNLFF